MEGGIYAEDKCEICGSSFVHHANRGYVCPKHKRQMSKRLRVRFRGIRRRFSSYDDANHFLSGLRFKADEGSFDKRDYATDNPLGFENFVKKYLLTKTNLKSYRDIQTHLKKAVSFFDQTNIKTIQYGELEDFLLVLDGLADKTKHNVMSDIHAFFAWACKREKQISMPEFPKVEYELGWRNTIGPDVQQDILDELFRISYDKNPKIYIGVKWLMTYISIRPNEMRNIKEGDFDFNLGVVLIRDPKEKGSKTVPLLPEDIETIKSFPKALPHLFFFRHGRYKGVSDKTRHQFGKDYFYYWWKKACRNLGIEGVDLYGGTRHSTARAMRLIHTPEQIKRATMHKTNKAFDRYFQIQLEDVRELYDMGTIRGQKKAPTSGAKVLKLNK